MVKYTLRGQVAQFSGLDTTFANAVLEIDVPRSLSEISYTILFDLPMSEADQDAMPIAFDQIDQILAAKIDGQNVFGPEFSEYPTIFEGTKDGVLSGALVIFDEPEGSVAEDDTRAIYVFDFAGASLLDRIDVREIFTGPATGWTFGGFDRIPETYDADYAFVLSEIPNVEISSTPADNSGDDTVLGVEGSEEIFGGAGNDDLSGFGGNDTLYGGPGNDTVAGGDGNDLIGGGAGNDSLSGGAGNDAIWTAAGDDRAFGGAGADTLGGALGNDSLQGGAGDDALWGAGGNDTLLGDDGNDTLGGSVGNDSLEGDTGDDALWGAADNDTVLGGTGDDTLGGATGNDSLDGGDGADEIWGGAGLDSAMGGNGADQIGAGLGDDQVDGGAGNDTVSGGADNDLLRGGADNDLIFAAGGDDTLSGDAGNDTLYGGAGADVFEFAASHGQDALYMVLAEDRLNLADDLWTGPLTEAEVLARFGSVSGADYRLAFGTDEILLIGLGSATQAQLEALIDIV